MSSHSWFEQIKFSTESTPPITSHLYVSLVRLNTLLHFGQGTLSKCTLSWFWIHFSRHDLQKWWPHFLIVMTSSNIVEQSEQVHIALNACISGTIRFVLIPIIVFFLSPLLIWKIIYNNSHWDVKHFCFN